VPLLSEIPIIGKTLFTGTTYSYSDSELLIFLTASIMEEKDVALGERAGVGIPFTTFPLER